MKKEELWKIYERNCDWIKFSDTKAGILLTIYGIIITIIYSNSSDLYLVLNQSKILVFTSTVVGITSIISVSFSFLCINPRLKNTNIKSNIFFGTITKNHLNLKSFKESLKKHKLKEDLQEQVYTTSKIADKKFKNITWSIRFFVLSLFILIINIIIHLF